MAPRWGGLRIEPYKSQPIDADMDKIVQEGTAWERPGGTRILNNFGKEILIGATATTRSRDIKIVDKNDNAVEYTPTYGVQGFEEAPSVVTDPAGTPTPQGRSGLQPIQTVTPAQQAELRKAREVREAQARAAAAGLPPVPERPPGDPEQWGSQEALRAEFRRTGRLDAARTPEGEAPVEIVLSDEERVDAIDEIISAIAERLTEPADESGDYTSVVLTEPKEDESGLVSAAREIINSPKVAALKKKLQRFVKFAAPVTGYEHSQAQGQIADYRRAVANAQVFFRDVHAMLQNMGVTSIEDAVQIIRDGFEVDGRRVVFVGQHLPKTPGTSGMISPEDLHTPALVEGKSTDMLREGFYVLDEHGEPLIPVDVEDIPEEMMQALLDDPDAPIPLELLVHAVREATRDSGGEALRIAAELEKSVSRVGKLLGEEVRTLRAKSIRESKRPTDFLSELLGRSIDELVANASNDAAKYLKHAGAIGLDLDRLDDSHIEDPVGTARINGVGAAVAERILGYIPEWARTDRSDKPHDPGRGYVDEAEGGAWDAAGEEGGWPTHQGMWNGDPLVLMDGLVDSLVNDFAAGKITEEQLLDTLGNLPSLVAEALHDEIDKPDRAPVLDFRGYDRSGVNLYFFRSFTGRQIAEGMAGVKADLKLGVNDIRMLHNMLKSFGVPESAYADLDLRTGVNLLSLFQAEYRLRLFYGKWPASESRAGMLPEERDVLPGDMIPAAITTPNLSSARGESLLENAWQLALKDALRQRRLGELRDDGLLPSAGAVRDEGYILQDIIRGIRQFVTTEDAIKELLSGPGRTRNSAGLIADTDVTENESHGIFENNPIVKLATFTGKEARMAEIMTPIVALLHKRNKATSIKARAAINREIENHLASLDEAEAAIIRALEYWPIEWIRRLGLAGRLGVRTHEERDTLDLRPPEPGEIVPYVPVDRSSYLPFSNRQYMWQPWEDGAVSLSPDGGDASALHEVTHRLDAIHPLFRPLVWAYIARRYNLDPDSPPSSITKMIMKINDMPARQRGGVIAYEDKEVGIDLFPHGYMGRTYVDRSDHRYIDDPSWDQDLEIPRANGVEMHPMEVLTVALEAFSMPAEQRPFFLYEEGVDSETINFILGLLATI